MIPRRVYNPPISASSSENRLKGPLPDWDSPSSHTGTVKRRPPSEEATTVILLSPIDIGETIDETSDSTSIATTEGFEINKDIETSVRKIAGQEIAPGNCNPNEKEKGNELLEQKRNYVTNTIAAASSSGCTQQPTSVQQHRKSRLKLPSQLSVGSGKYASHANDAASTAKCDETKSSYASRRPGSFYGSAGLAGRQPTAGPKHPQVQRLKEGSAQQHPPPNQPARNAVTVATSHDLRPRAIVDNNNTANELHQNKNKQQIDDGDTSKKYIFKKLPPANKLKFQDSAAATVFTELYRDFPVNYASMTVVESIPLKPPPYCNPPPAPPPSTLPLYKQTANCSSIEASPTKIRLDNENEITQAAINNVAAKQQQPPPSVKSDCTAHRIANELRLKGNFALQKLTNISKLNHKNNRFFTSSSSKTIAEPSAPSPAKKIDDEPCATTVAQASTTPTHSAHIKDESDKDATRENLNDYILFNPVRQSSGVFIKMGAKKSPPCDILTKPEFSSSLFKNIPVRPRKGVPHLENYCLFDPSKDFVNEKEIKRMEALTAMVNDRFVVDDDEFIDEIIYEDQLVYDTLEDDSTSANYFTIDPDYLEKSPAEPLVPLPNATMERHSQQIENIEKIIDDFLSSSGDSRKTIELVDATDYGQFPHSGYISQISRKKSPQIDKLVRQSTLPTAASRRTASLPPHRNDSCPRTTNTKDFSTPTHQRTRDFREKSQSLASQKVYLKHSVSLPQLQSLIDDVLADASNGHDSSNEPNYALFNPTPVPSRSIQYKTRYGRPLSTHSDADSGFLSPVTPPEGLMTTTAQAAPAVIVLQQCDSIQGYIEVCQDF